MNSINWWVRPHLIVLALVVPVFAMCATLTDTDFLQYEVYKSFFSATNILIGTAALGIFILAIIASSNGISNAANAPTIHQRLGSIPEAYYNTIATRVGVVVLLAYAIFFLPLLSNPGLMIELFRGSQTAMFQLRDTLNSIPGVTSLTNLQSLYVILYLLHRHIYQKAPPVILSRIFMLLAACCVLRMFVWSERITLMEFAIPYILLRYGTKPASLTMRRFMAMAPLYGVVGIIILFGVGEYFRSWQYYNQQGDSFLSFVITRLCGYYATAINNVLGFYTVHGPSYQPIITGNWFYKLPFSAMLGIKGDDSLLDFLESDLNPEFNNPSGLYGPILDFGLVLGLATWAVLGVIVGKLYKGFVTGQLLGLLFYPSVFIGIVEVLRIFYWGNSRYFPTIVVTLLVYRALKSALNRSQINNLTPKAPNPAVSIPRRISRKT